MKSTNYPFYSLFRGIGVLDAYHSHPACQIGQSVALVHRLPGNPLHWPECRYCRLHHTPLKRQPALDYLTRFPKLNREVAPPDTGA
jgi:hypothetical protein